MPLVERAAASSATSTSGQVSSLDQILVFNLDIAIMIAILFFAAFNAPRAVARFANRSEWSQGHLLRYSSLSAKPRINLNTHSIYLESDPSKPVVALDANTESCSTAFKALPPLPHQAREKAVLASSAGEPPVHMPMISSLTCSLTRILSHRVHQGYTTSQVLLMAGYMAAVFYAGFYKSNPFTDPLRAGWVVASQVPFLYIFATKNNVVGILLGVGYEKLNFLHRLIGRMVFVGANVHTIGYIYKWSLAGQMSVELAKPSVRWGFVGLACFDLLVVCSTQYVRSKSYNLFIATHVLASFVFLFAAGLHIPGLVPYIIAASVFYGLDHLLRLVKTRIAIATIRPIPELGLTRIEIPSINAGWRAGQHIRLRVLSAGMGFMGLMEVHPFTIANAANTQEGLILMCAKAGGWTSKMFELSRTAAYGEHGREIGKTVRVMIEGPYGGVGNTVIASYSGVLLVAGGSGITFTLSAVQDLVRAGSASSVRIIDLVWSIPDTASLIPMIPFFASLISQSTHARVRISVYYTRAVKESFQQTYLPPGITLTPGRPKAAGLLDEIVASTQSEGGVTGVFVGVCGPVSLADDVAGAVRTFDVYRKRAVGGVELHEEVFGW